MKSPCETLAHNLASVFIVVSTTLFDLIHGSVHSWLKYSNQSYKSLILTETTPLNHSAVQIKTSIYEM